MSRVLLISSNTTREPMPVYPLGMALVAASLTEDGHQVKQLDLIVHPDNMFSCATETIKAFAPDVIGISVRNIDTVDSLSSPDAWYLAGIKDLVCHIKGFTPASVILGGPAFSIIPEKMLAFLGADFGIVGEGEILVKKLIHAIENNIECPKIWYPSQKQMDAADFYSPLYEPDLVNFYLDQSGMVNYQTKRGCPYRCNYCCYPVIEGKKIRYQEPGFIVENLLALKNRFHADTVFFTDSVFNDPKERYLELAEMMIKKNCNMKWAAYFRPEKITPDKLSLLKRSGLYAIEIGSDAACDTTLQGMGKSYDFDTVRAMNEACVNADIPCAHFFIFGGSGETHATVSEGINNIDSLENCAVFIFSGIRILPNTGIHKIAIDQGVLNRDDPLLESRYYVSPDIDKAWMDNMLKSTYKRQRDRFFPPEEGQMRMKALKMFGFKGILWDMAIKMNNTKAV